MNPESHYFDPAQNGVNSPAVPTAHREELFKLLVTSVRDYAIFMVDPSGRIITWNEGAERTKGYTADEIIGKHLSIFYLPESRASNHAEHALDIAKKVGRYEEEGWRVRKDGSVFWANVIITALYDQGNLVGFAKVTRDLTERKKLEEEQAANERLLQETNEELQRLAYVVSHELQSPIATISRYSNLLNIRYTDRLGEDANEFITKISDSSKLIARMVDDLWTYARISRPGTMVETLSLNAALDEALEELHEMRAGAVITYAKDLPQVRGNRRQLVYLFKELISNGIKYHRDQTPTVDVSWNRQNGGFAVMVQDNGVGIDIIHAQDIFKIFQRVNGAPEPGGTGMGLAICKKIMQQHKGRISFESTVGSGTTFYMYFPNPTGT